MSRNWSSKSTGDEVVEAFSAHVNGRTFLITGPSEAGLGAETAYSLAATASPSLLILAGRDKTKIDPVIAKIHSLNSAVKTLFVPLDLADQSSVRHAAETINAQVGTIDVLINNAAIMACPYGKTKDGIELQFGVNFLGPFLFTNLILGKLRAAGPGARIVNLSSSAHRFSGIRFDNWGFDNWRLYEPFEAYGQSKTAAILFSIHLASRLPKEEIAVFSLHPGSIVSPLQQYLNPEVTKNAITKAQQIPNFELSEPRSLQEGCATSLIAALDPVLESHSGAYLNDGQISTQAEHAQGLDNAAKLWKLGESIVGQDFSL
ncbi:hypothetical protein AJ80_08198 [Polytolypa hystricis UAMH7299]|uniref:Oxidoreductase n=1 Tax=Polytolypa hystricis (strain UAMH7299) TaxID=1447883 RepID=A0A2B7XBG2_POLH7|nr:hypothetical protein AJ80_08198 [Polytolypa hystricis UAMH7299]